MLITEWLSDSRPRALLLTPANTNTPPRDAVKRRLWFRGIKKMLNLTNEKKTEKNWPVSLLSKQTKKN